MLSGPYPSPLRVRGMAAENIWSRGVVLGETYIIAGLGNPGSKYEHTRHNAGFLAMDVLSEKLGIHVSKVKHKALIGEGLLDNDRIVLMKPQTFMNDSGESIREAVDWYKIPVEHLIVMYDDIDLESGVIRVRPSGSAGTHNGMRSILDHIPSDAFPRVRIGIGKPLPQWDLADFVLGRFTEEEMKLISGSIVNAADAAAAIVRSSVQTVMNTYNKRK